MPEGCVTSGGVPRCESSTHNDSVKIFQMTHVRRKRHSDAVMECSIWPRRLAAIDIRFCACCIL